MKTLLPFFAWLLWLIAAGPALLQSNWEIALLLFAAWMLVPPGLSLLRLPVQSLYWLTVFALSLAYYLTDAPASWRGLLALPYVGLSAWITIRELTQLFTLPKIQLPDIVRVAAIAYWSTGAVWALCFLTGFRPLDFDLVIVSLTAAHFHVAGFVLAVVAYRMLLAAPGRVTQISGWGVLAGMPSVAAGITLTKLGYAPAFEWVAALLFVLFTAVIVAWHVSKWPDKKYILAARHYWLGGAFCLLAGILLASLYALRFMYPVEWVHIPNMKIWHGTLNTLGFAWLTLRGWQLVISY
ncbi:MAG: YndJ family transporter [Lewinellaceae bacterium]|nr:YndJ family transporter [Lewinellaceae bacterium]